MTKRKFYKTTFTFSVMSEEPIPEGLGIEDIMAEATDGAYSADMDIDRKEEVCNGLQAAEELCAQGSSPSFFQLDEFGNDSDDS